MLQGRYCHYHIGSEDGTVRAFEALRLYLKYLTHKHSVLSSLYITALYKKHSFYNLLSFSKIQSHLLQKERRIPV